MVAKPETLNRFIFNSDYPMDKIIWLYEGQLTTPSSAGNTQYTYISVPTILGSSAVIYVKGAYSLDDWQTAVMLGTYPINDPAKAISTTLEWVTSSGGRLSIGVSAGNSAATSKTVKYRLWGVQREDIAYAIDYSKNSSVIKNKLNFNTDNNYPRLYKEGVATSGDVITHNLGHIPYVDFWYILKVDSSISPDILTRQWWYQPIGELKTGTNYNATVKATDKTITFSKMYGDTYDAYYYYRIYA